MLPATAPPATCTTSPPWVLALTPVQQAATEYHAMGLSIGPTKPASKFPYLWRRLVGVRINPAYIPELFDNRAGVFVIVGAISGNLCILDADTERAARFHAAEFARRGLRPWVVSTARGRHFWWLSPDGELANVRNEKMPGGEAELRGHTCYCLAPPSVHPSGVIYDWLERDGDRPPAIPLAALDWLPVTLRKLARRKPDTPTPAPDDPPSEATRDFIAAGAPEGERHDRLFAAACDLAGNGHTLAGARELLTPPAERVGLPRREIEATINSAFSRPRTPTPTPTPTPPDWVRALTWADSHHWARLEASTAARRVAVSADTARAVFLACCERARKDHPRAVFRASTRELAELASVMSNTAHRALLCFVAAGWLRRCGYSKMMGAGLFAFGQPVLLQMRYSITTGLSTVSYLQQLDAFGRGALARSGARVWRLILTEALEPAKIARRLKCHRSTVGRALERLAQHGLAEPAGRGKWAGNPAGADFLRTVAVKCGTAGRAEQRKARHAAERAEDVCRAILRRKRSLEAGT